MKLIPLEVCADCGRAPEIKDDSWGTKTAHRVLKWYACDCGRRSSGRGCCTRAEAAKAWNRTMRFLVSYRKRQKK